MPGMNGFEVCQPDQGPAGNPRRSGHLHQRAARDGGEGKGIRIRGSRLCHEALPARGACSHGFARIWNCIACAAISRERLRCEPPSCGTARPLWRARTVNCVRSADATRLWCAPPASRRCLKPSAVSFARKLATAWPGLAMQEGDSAGTVLPGGLGRIRGGLSDHSQHRLGWYEGKAQSRRIGNPKRQAGLHSGFGTARRSGREALQAGLPLLHLRPA